MTLNFKKLNENATIPKRATEYSAGLDLCACLDEDLTIKPGERYLVPTGLAVSPSDKNVVLLVYARSSLASKHGLTLSNCVGVVDSDYRGELKIPMINHSDTPYTITHGERVAQLVVSPVIFADTCEVDVLDETTRGEGGFGSTGKI